jgi:hypothetical protein
VPLIDVSYDQAVSEPDLSRLAILLPEIVAEAVNCPEEPWTGPPAPGDIEIRFRRKGTLDVGELNCVIEVRTKLFESRLANKQHRSDLIRDRVADQMNVGAIGVWLILGEGAWSQT